MFAIPEYASANLELSCIKYMDMYSQPMLQQWLHMIESSLIHDMI